MTIEEISQKLEVEGLSPLDLTELLTILSAKAAQLNTAMEKIQLVKPARWLELQKGEGKPLSEKRTDMVWATTPEGQDEIKIKHRLKACELMLSSIKKRLWANKVEYQTLNTDF